MKVLIVSNECDRKKRLGNPIIPRLVKSLKKNKDIESAAFSPFRNKVSDFLRIRRVSRKYDIVHIQFGGLYALLVWFSLLGVKIPKLITFHGTDIHAKEMSTAKSVLSKIKIWLSQKASFLLILAMDKSGFVSDSLYQYVPKWILNRRKKQLFVQPLGVDYDAFRLMTKKEACESLGIKNRRYALFSDKSSTTLKRKDIPDAIIDELGGVYELLYMCNVKAEMVPYYVNACDFLLLTSDEEGSPNIIREALAVNKRVFSVDVGDAKEQLKGLANSSIVSRNPHEASLTIRSVLQRSYTDNTRDRLRAKLDIANTTDSLVKLYKRLQINNATTK